MAKRKKQIRPAESVGVADGTASQPTIKPPGVVSPGGFGPSDTKVTRRGVARLRGLMNLSAQVSLIQLCEDASDEIERMRSLEKPKQRRKSVEQQERSIPI